MSHVYSPFCVLSHEKIVHFVTDPIFVSEFWLDIHVCGLVVNQCFSLLLTTICFDIVFLFILEIPQMIDVSPFNWVGHFYFCV